MAKQDENGNVVKLIQDAVTEANEFKGRLERGEEEDYVFTSEMLNAKYRKVMDAAEEAITHEYKSGGSLTGARVCEINNGMDDYALTMQKVMDFIRKLDGDQE